MVKAFSILFKDRVASIDEKIRESSLRRFGHVDLQNEDKCQFKLRERKKGLLDIPQGRPCI